MVIDYSWDRTNRLNRFCRSDQVSYIRKGIPTIYFSTGYSRDYHQATDEPQYINYDLTARVARFVHDVAQAAAAIEPPSEMELKDPSEWTILGKPQPRVDTHEKVTGAPIFGIDVDLPDMLHGTVLMNPRLGGGISSKYREVRIPRLVAAAEHLRSGDLLL